MENDNIRKDEEMFEDVQAEEVSTTEENIETKGAETSEPEIIEADAESEVVIEEAAEEAVELTEEEIEAIKTIKRKKYKKGIIVASIIAAIVAICAFFICYTEGVGGNTVVNNPLPLEDESATQAETGFWGNLATDNIRYENPAVSLFENVIGKNKNVALKVNGLPVSKGVFNYAVNSMAYNTAGYLLQTGFITDINEFDWDKIEEESGLSYKEMAKALAVNAVSSMYSIISEGEKHGIVLDEADKAEAKEWLETQKANYGDEFEMVLKSNGYDSEESLLEMYTAQILANKIYKDMESNMSDYITPQIEAQVSGDKVTVKHILIAFKNEEDGTVSDNAKADAKEKAEMVLAKVKAGEDFEKLIEEYNEDPGATSDGYTFANDGTMVQSFADASFALEIGAVSELVETNYGYHIIKRMERAVTLDEYTQLLQKTVDITLKKGVFDNTDITLDFNLIFGTSDAVDDSK
ncbi:MAG: peptidylprolyl isomerase [Clostridia bacterium]|nr:peptidylprolyl isomerase [Clostridia bacterium]